MTLTEFESLHLTQICAILNTYDCYRWGENTSWSNGNGLDRVGREWLVYRGIYTSPAFAAWLKYQRIENYPAY